jgi:[acyl-carrier-protein] S-malonyltransferase
MQEAVPVGEGAMAALLGLDSAEVEALCREAAQGDVLSAANLNSPAQIVIAGSTGAVNRAVALAPSRGAKKAILLPVSAPFHCALMKPAERRLEEDLNRVAFHDPEVPLVNNAEARLLTAGAEVRASLIRQVCSPVRWAETIRLLAEQQVRLFIEIGPGRVLSGLIRQVDKGLKLANVEDAKSLQTTLEAVSQNA